MNKTNDGGQAYPAAWGNPSLGGDYIEGMTLRDYFAGQALASWPITDKHSDITFFVKKCYALADAMIEERNRGKE